MNGVTTSFIRDLADGIPLILQAGTTKYGTGMGGLPIEQIDSTNTVLYYYQDQLGSTRQLLDSTATVKGTFNYNPYGDLKSSTGTATTPFGYGGQYTDAESGLIYLRARYYDPATEQFLSLDALQGATGEPYAYTVGDPLNAADPLGLDPGCVLASPQSCVQNGWNWTNANSGTITQIAGGVLIVATVVDVAPVIVVVDGVGVVTGGLAANVTTVKAAMSPPCSI